MDELFAIPLLLAAIRVGENPSPSFESMGRVSKYIVI
jgi:hypothetical protein